MEEPMACRVRSASIQANNVGFLPGLPDNRCPLLSLDIQSSFQQTCHELHVRVMRSIALGLDLDEGFFDSKVDQQCHNLRLLSYPSVKRSLLEGEGQARAGAHSGKTPQNATRYGP